MGIEEMFKQEDLDDAKAVEFIMNQLPQEVKEKIKEDEIFYFLDLLDEYYVESGILDVEPDEEGFIDIDLEKIANHLAKEAKKDKIGDFSADELLLLIQAEMDYTDSLFGEE